MDGEMMTRVEVSLHCGLSEYQIWKLVKRGDLPAFRLGEAKNSRLRFRRSDVERWLEERRVPVEIR